MTDNFYMNLALREAWKFQFLTYPNPAVGCVIVDRNGKILAIAAHEAAGHAHAELNAVISALKTLKPSLNIPAEPNAAYEFIAKHHDNALCGAVAFVSLEPCAHFGKTPPCASLLSTLKFKKVFVGAVDTHEKAKGGAQILRENGVKVEFKVCENEALALLKPFLKWQNGTFKLFKLAISANGSALGKIISSEESRIYAHKIRSKVDVLVVGGETVRCDRPILDARLANAKAPDLCILSRRNLAEFDKEIPLFKVKNRQIYDKIPPNAKFAMFEGGENFLKLVKSQMDAFLIFQNARFVREKNVLCEGDFKPLFRGELGGDSYGIYEL